MTTSDDYCPVPQGDEAPPDGLIAEMLGRIESVAIVGASPDPSRTSHQIALWLMANTPYQLFMVNPAAEGQEIRGHGFFPTLEDLPVRPHLVNVFRRPEFVPDVTAEAIKVGAVGLWLQLGITHPGAALAAADAGLTVVQNRCIKVEYTRLREQIEPHRVYPGHS